MPRVGFESTIPALSKHALDKAAAMICVFLSQWTRNPVPVILLLIENCLIFLYTYMYIHAYVCVLTYLRSWALLEELTIVQSLRNPPAFYGTRRFNTVFTRALHWSLSWAISIQSTPSHPVYVCIYIYISAVPIRCIKSYSPTMFVSLRLCGVNIFTVQHPILVKWYVVTRQQLLCNKRPRHHSDKHVFLREHNCIRKGVIMNALILAWEREMVCAHAHLKHMTGCK
jgi:hypothetical protein